jgi:hypothetical protein
MTDEELYAAAEKEYGSCDIEIIRDIPISRGEDAGAWVPAYVWVAFPEATKE